MNLFVYELKKIFSKRTVIVLLVIFLLLDILKIYMIYSDTIKADTLYEGRQKVLCEIKGPITEKNLTFIINRKNELEELVANRTYSTEYNPSTYSGYEFGDYIIFNDIYDELDYAYHYSDLLEKINSKANENMILFPDSSAEVKSAEKILKIYKDREILNYYDYTGYETYFYYDFSSLLVVLLILFFTTPVFSEEIELKMDSLILSSYKGKYATRRGKVLASIVVALLITLLFNFLDYIMFFVLFGFEGGVNPLYSLQSFAHTPFNGSIIQFVFFSIVCEIIGNIFFCSVFLFFSSISKKVLSAMICGIGILGFFVLWNDFVSINYLRLLTPISLLNCREIYQSFYTVELLGLSIDIRTLLATIVILSESVLLIFNVSKKAKWRKSI